MRRLPGSDQSDAVLLEQAARIGLPLMIKRGGRGGPHAAGIGMKTWASLAQARSEAQQASAAAIVLERALIIRASRNASVCLPRSGHRASDCSVQRRHQKR